MLYKTKTERKILINEYAYVRCSTTEQHEDRQLAAMQAAGIPRKNIYVDKISGKDFNRPAYQILLRKLKRGDLLYIKSIDRLGRDYFHIQNEWRALTKERGVDIMVLDMPILDTRKDKDLMGTYIADTILALLSFVAQKEREDIRGRQREGITAAKARGVHMGRPIKRSPENFVETVKLWERGIINFEDAVEQTGLKQATFYRRLRESRG